MIPEAALREDFVGVATIRAGVTRPFVSVFDVLLQIGSRFELFGTLRAPVGAGVTVAVHLMLQQLRLGPVALPALVTTVEVAPWSRRRGGGSGRKEGHASLVMVGIFCWPCEICKRLNR